jgi:hypothetical protein
MGGCPRCGKEGHHLSLEGRNVGRFAARDPLLVYDYFLVHPVPSGIPNVVSNRVVPVSREVGAVQKVGP